MDLFHRPLLTSLTLAATLVVSPARAAAVGCNTVGRNAANQASEGASDSGALQAASAALMATMIAACSTGYACAPATAAYMGFSALNGMQGQLAGSTSGLGAAAINARNAGKDCEDDAPPPGGAPDGDPTTICLNPAACRCTGAEKDSPLCSKDKWKKLGQTMRENLDGLRNPDLKLGDEANKDDMIADLESALANYDAFTAAMEGEGGAGNPNAAGAATKVAGGGSGDASSSLDPSQVGAKAGPANGAGLGGAYALNGLQLIDKNTDQELTIWQRATRRHQNSPGNKRGLFLARLEYLRANAAQLAATSEKAKPDFAKDLSTTAVPNPAPPTPVSDPKAAQRASASTHK